MAADEPDAIADGTAHRGFRRADVRDDAPLGARVEARGDLLDESRDRGRDEGHLGTGERLLELGRGDGRRAPRVTAIASVAPSGSQPATRSMPAFFAARPTDAPIRPVPTMARREIPISGEV